MLSMVSMPMFFFGYIVPLMHSLQATALHHFSDHKKEMNAFKLLVGRVGIEVTVRHPDVSQSTLSGLRFQMKVANFNFHCNISITNHIVGPIKINLCSVNLSLKKNDLCICSRRTILFFQNNINQSRRSNRCFDQR